MKRLFTAVLIVIGAITIAPSVTAQAATVQSAVHRETLGERVLDIAETRTGDPYSYGSAGPSAFDCSGLVYWAAAQLGISLPRTTFTMIYSHHLRRVWGHPQRGWIAFWGPIEAPYHVEIMTIWPDTSYGARDWGEPVGWHSDRYFAPSAYYELV
ncbi:MAG TPA: NlpC/P60 family protein [Nitrospira sp.]|nr:NlpC/P60 family protein [Nitrospira sp.]